MTSSSFLSIAMLPFRISSIYSLRNLVSSFYSPNVSNYYNFLKLTSLITLSNYILTLSFFYRYEALSPYISLRCRQSNSSSCFLWACLFSSICTSTSRFLLTSYSFFYRWIRRAQTASLVCLSFSYSIYFWRRSISAYSSAKLLSFSLFSI